MLEIDTEKFEEARNKAEIFYRSIGEVYCPYFKEKVAFNAKGWEHLRFNAPRQARAQELKDLFKKE